MPFYIMSLPSLVLYSFFFGIPVVSGVYYSLTDWDGMSKSYRFIGLDNYLNSFQDGRFWNSFRFTFQYTFILVAAVIVISLAIALLLNAEIKAKGFFRSVYFFPAVLSLITVGLIFNQIFYRAVPQLGERFGIECLQSNLLGNPQLAIWGILITNIWQGAAMPAIVFLAGLQSVPKDLYEAATIDGANGIQKFRFITIPFLIPMLSINLVLVVKSGLTVFDYIVAMTDGGPGRATESIAYIIYQQGFRQYQFAYGVAQSIILLIIIVFLSVIQTKLLSRKEVGQQ
ncbi:MAG: sugar ABC transporter permease [Provencibacterium sp.]|nr:sugar ABC transporter permease [Provencibacterium sp.]